MVVSITPRVGVGIDEGGQTIFLIRRQYSAGECQPEHDDGRRDQQQQDANRYARDQEDTERGEAVDENRTCLPLSEDQCAEDREEDEPARDARGLGRRVTAGEHRGEGNDDRKFGELGRLQGDEPDWNQPLVPLTSVPRGLSTKSNINTAAKTNRPRKFRHSR